jgi:hypothetical protein
MAKTKAERFHEYLVKSEYKAIKKYNKEKTKTMTIRFMLGTEADLLSFVNSKPNKAGYIKGLIRADMAGGKA